MHFLRKVLLGLALVAPALADPPVIQSDQYAKLTVSRGLQMQDGSTLSSLGFSNLAKNAGAELISSPTSSWTASAGAFDTTTTAANVASGARSFSFNASATGQTVTSAQLTVPTSYYAAEGVMYFRYKTAATDYTIRPVVNGVAGTAVTLAAATQFTQAGLQFTFPTSGYVQFRLSSASDAAVIYFDDVVVGPKLTPVGVTSYGDVIPSATNTYDLGTNALRWKDLYLADDIVVGGTPTFEACNAASVLTTNSSGVMACTATLGATLGGSGFSSFTVGNVLYADTTTSLAKLAPGSNGTVLTISGGVPAWAAPGGPTSGGTGQTGYTTGDTLYASATDTLSKLAIGTAGQGMVVSAGVPAWGTLGVAGGGTGFTTYSTGDMIYASGANTLAKRAAGSNGQILTLAGGVPTWANAGSAGTSSDATFTLTDDADPTKVLAFDVAGTTGTTTTLATSQTSNRTVTLPDAAGTVLLNDNTATVTGKSIDGDDNTVTDLSNGAIKAAAGIAVNKLAALTASKAVETDGSGFLASSAFGPAASANTASAVVARDGSGNFAAGTITADLTGTASAATLAAGATALAANPTDCASDTYATTIAANGNLTCATVTNAGLAGSIEASKLVGSDIATVGTVTTGTWSATAIGETKGGTGQTSYTQGDLLYASAANTLSKLAKGTASQVLKMNAGATAPEWGVGGGAGGINFLGLDSSWASTNVTDRDAETTVGNWTAYADAAATSPVDMTAGSPNTTCTRTTTGGELMNGTGSFKMTVTTGATRQGEGCASTMYVPLAYRGGTATITFPFVTTGTITEDDFKVFIYDQTNSEVVTPYVSSKLLGTQGTVTATFATKTTTAQMRVGIHIARAVNTGAVTVMFDDVLVGPGSTPKGLAGGNWYDDSANWTWTGAGTVTENVVYSRRVGDSLEVRGYMQFGTPTGSALSMDTTKYTFDTSKFTTSVNTQRIGTFDRVQDTLTVAGTAIDYNGSDTNSVYFSTANSSDRYENKAGNVLGASGDRIAFNFTVPISGWDANVTMAESSQFRISSYLANGSRVTGSAPTALGQYRSYLRDAGARTFTETNGAPTFTPTASDGFRIYNGNAYSSADTNNEPTRYEIFVGKNKTTRLQCYATTGQTGFVDIQPQNDSGGDQGYYQNYDPTTGIFSISANRYFTGGATHTSGATVTGAATNDPYCDVIVSENAVAVGMQVPRCQSVYTVGAGYGSTDSKVRRIETVISSETYGTCVNYATSSTAGSTWTLAESGVYTACYSDVRGAGAFTLGISRNSSELTTNIQSITSANILAVTDGTAAGRANVCGTFIGSAGDVIRPHGESVLSDTTSSVRFRITKVAN